MARSRPATQPDAPCPCGGGRFAECCAPILAGLLEAASAERLMRSRYTAFVLGDRSYLLASWHPETRPAQLELEAPQPKWIGLAILAATPGPGPLAEVEFIARYRVGGRAQRLHETSRFESIAGRWYYRDGVIHD